MKGLPQFILASHSPRRAALLKEAGYQFRVAPSPLPELTRPVYAGSPPQLAEALAYFKARSVRKEHPAEIVLGADTIVARGSDTLGKAEDADQARRMLSAISGTRHAVITGLALLVPAPGGMEERFLASDITYVSMRRLSDEEIDRYVASGEWHDKAGAYAIQEAADAFVERLEGSFTNVVGLPMELLEKMLAAAARSTSESAG